MKLQEVMKHIHMSDIGWGGLGASVGVLLSTLTNHTPSSLLQTGISILLGMMLAVYLLARRRLRKAKEKLD